LLKFNSFGIYGSSNYYNIKLETCHDVEVVFVRCMVPHSPALVHLRSPLTCICHLASQFLHALDEHYFENVEKCGEYIIKIASFKESD